MNDVFEESGKKRDGMSVDKYSVGDSRTVRWWYGDKAADCVPGGLLTTL